MTGVPAGGLPKMTTLVSRSSSPTLSASLLWSITAKTFIPRASTAITRRPASSGILRGVLSQRKWAVRKRAMSYEERKRLIAELQNVRHSRVLCFVLSDREAFPAAIPGFAPTMASDSLLRVRDLLHEIGRVEQLDLFLYTRGGAVETVWPLVTNLRSHCERLSILVPYRAHSAGTMLCLGADELLMSDGAELSPIDPTTGNPFNPRNPTNQANQFGISVEDVTAYFDFARTVAGISQ